MSAVAPITAIVAPFIPILYNFLTNPSYNEFQAVAIIVSLTAILLVSNPKKGQIFFVIRDIQLGFISGIGFGLFLILIDQASTITSYFLPLMISRIVVIFLMFPILMINKKFQEINWKSILMIGTIGVLDAFSNIFFIL